MKAMRLLQTVLFLLAIFEALSRAVGADAHVPETTYNLSQPTNLKSRQAVPPPPPRRQAKLPAELVTTWFTGVVPPTDYYDPATGEWRDTNGLGQMYTFEANGDYVYAGFLRLQIGLCVTEVSTYKEGKAQATAGNLTLRPSLAKTRTVVKCGSNSDTTTDGPFDPTTIAYSVVEDATGLIQLTLTDKEISTTYSRQGMVPSLVGSWRRGDVTSVDFYDPETQRFTRQKGEGGWYRMNADGTFSLGEFGYGTDDEGCILTVWLYQEGRVSISGGQMTVTPLSGVARLEDACDPTGSERIPYVKEERSYTWFYRDRESELKLVLIRDDSSEFIFIPE